VQKEVGDGGARCLLSGRGGEGKRGGGVPAWGAPCSGEERAGWWSNVWWSSGGPGTSKGTGAAEVAVGRRIEDACAGGGPDREWFVGRLLWARPSEQCLF
jgi:hypothetical protein